MKGFEMGDYPGFPIITRVLIKMSQRDPSQKRRCDDGSRGQSNVTTSQGM